MSQFVDRLMLFNKYVGTFADGHGVVTRRKAERGRAADPGGW